MTITYPGEAKPGDVIRDPEGRLLDVVSIVYASDWLDHRTLTQIATDPRVYVRNCPSAIAIQFGDTGGREKRDHERWQKKVGRQKCGN